MRCRGADYRKGSKMGYIEHSLGANEVLIYKARFHWLYYGAAWATLILRGWLSRSTDELQLKAIEQVNFKQGFLGRLIGFGQVEVHGTGVDDPHIPAIADPHGLLKAIEEATSPSKQTTGSA